MDALSKISSRVTDLTRKQRAKRLEHDDSFSSFVPPTYDAHQPSMSSSYASVPTASCDAKPTPSKENGPSKNTIVNGIRRFSPFPRKSGSTENKETTSITSEEKTKEVKDSKYHKIEKRGDEEPSERNGMWKLKDTAMGKVDRLKKGRHGEYGEQLLDSDQD